MSISIFSLTKGGYGLAKELNNHYPEAHMYVSAKIGQPPHQLMDGDMKACVAEAFKRDTAIVFIMATGIVVRMLAPLLKHKAEDPAVIVIDEKGRHVINLLSGHIGGGNQLTMEIADKLKSTPVITTSSDVQGKIAVDVLAINNKLVIDSMKDATTFASHVVNDEAVQLVTDGKVLLELDGQWTVNPENFDDEDYVLYISPINPSFTPGLRLVPKNIVLGIGCRRGKSKEAILEAIKSAVSSLNIDMRSLYKIGTVDVKADEIGLIQAAKALSLPLEIVDRSAIKEIDHQFEGSDFVEKTIGVRTVCEPSALLASNKAGRFLMEKTAYDGITIAVWEEAYEIR